MEILELLSLASNEFTGSISPGLGYKLPRLREMHLYENKFSSTIPKSLFQPVNLTAMLLYNNGFTGGLNGDLVDGAKNLVHLYLNDNNLSGNLGGFVNAKGLESLKKLRLE